MRQPKDQSVTNGILPTQVDLSRPRKLDVTQRTLGSGDHAKETSEFQSPLRSLAPFKFPQRLIVTSTLEAWH